MREKIARPHPRNDEKTPRENRKDHKKRLEERGSKTN